MNAFVSKGFAYVPKTGLFPMLALERLAYMLPPNTSVTILATPRFIKISCPYWVEADKLRFVDFLNANV